MWEDQGEDDEQEEVSLGGQLLSDILATSKYGKLWVERTAGQVPLPLPPRPRQKGPVGPQGGPSLSSWAHWAWP